MILQSYCIINTKHVVLNDKEIFVSPTISLENMYHSLQLDYPKFFKMDNLSKLGFLGAELILNQHFNDKENRIKKEDMSIICCNSVASLDNDRRYQTTIADSAFFPSPAIFVYTLPNIVNGEIAIRHKIMGETSFFILPKFSAKTILELSQSAFSDADITYVLSGWINFEFGKGDLFLVLLQRSKKQYDNIDEKILNQLYIKYQ